MTVEFGLDALQASDKEELEKIREELGISGSYDPKKKLGSLIRVA